MDIREISPDYAVSPQIEPGDLPAIKAAGFAAVICNRPDAENPPALQADEMARAAKAAGLDFHVLELTHQTMTPENIARQRDLIADADGPVLAYCASGTRCSVIWSLGQAGHMPVDDILAATGKAGYQLEQLRPALDAMAAQAKG
ncbi:TIGR01244 family sulfur transferase [Lutimaribacter sp. EGI FJ00015]|uniref:TIGR01244 family sulfur transferase n=1 Tax=Lutimaribacter degradans TaxID=2945989 RepID=A0ACC5ZS36_9RHOB|nr:TIGR01244 family sulfur transferase [Lutimaribacter sp. EGI FJ00013]MCM2560907.1 TIGR01244 family sulfur transferase [Lutimaribacter sp. EGI FJ00013]MCO0612148.1 TIGR01244 family sulfur transferase [Lutimaribacter sp. EGI FJ00015]MCO0634732.1 TIGR01244 family sulfur transferase [Lutimaribacter sp. EGI FJ00014]